MSKEIVLALGGNALGDDLTGRMKAVKIISQVIVDLIVQGHEVIVTHSNGSQVGMISQVFEAAAKTEARSPMLPVSVCVALGQGCIDHDLQNALREELLSRGIDRPVAALVTQIEANVSGPAFLNPTKPIGSFFAKQEAELLAKQGYTLKEDAGRGYRRIVALSEPADITKEEAVKALVDVGQAVITIGGGGISAICEGNHLRGASAVIDRDWANARLAEMTDANMLITLAVVEKMAINFGKGDEQWLSRLSLSDAKCFIEEGHFAKGSVLPKVEAATSSVRSRAGREALITVLSKAKEETEGRTGMVICQ